MVREERVFVVFLRYLLQLKSLFDAHTTFCFIIMLEREGRGGEGEEEGKITSSTVDDIIPGKISSDAADLGIKGDGPLGAGGERKSDDVSSLRDDNRRVAEGCLHGDSAGPT